MLEYFFGSKTRVHLLSLLLNNPQRAYYIRELTRKLGAQINSIRKELALLEKIGAVVIKEDNNALVSQLSSKTKKVTKKTDSSRGLAKKYYKINTNFILYPELKGLFLKSQLIAEKNLSKQILHLGSIQLLILTGIFCGQKDSFTDILVVGNINRRKLAQIVKKFEGHFNDSVKYTVMSAKEFKYRRDITDKFLFSIIENDKKIVIENKAGISV